MPRPWVLGTNWPKYYAQLREMLVDGPCIRITWCGMKPGSGGRPHPLGDSPLYFPVEQSKGQAFILWPSVSNWWPVSVARGRTILVIFSFYQGYVILSETRCSIKGRDYTIVGTKAAKKFFPHLLVQHFVQDKTLNHLMARFYWLGIHSDVCRWHAACCRRQLVNPPATPKVLFH